MSPQWVAGNVRARALLNRRLGVGRARVLAAMNSLTDAQHALAATAYGRDITVGQPALDTDHAVCAALLWHLRVLAGWQPAQGAQAIRALAAGFEASNIAAHARRLAGMPAPPPHTLGALATAWPRLSETSSLAQLRDILAQTMWGDPASESPSDIALAVQVGWAARVANAVPEARAWACTRLALTVARRRLAEERELPEPVLMHARHMLGADAAATDLASFADALAVLPRQVGQPCDGRDLPNC